MASPSKEERVLRLILENSPLKEWHFQEVMKESKITRAIANKWLRKFVSEGLLQHIKQKGKFPYYTVGSQNPVYYSFKRVFALDQFHKSGLIAQLLSLKKSKTVILFGSMIKGDWYKDSDVDIFIFGDASDFDKHLYERKLRKKIELHVFFNKQEIDAMTTGLIQNILNGYVVKGQIQDFARVI